MIGQYRKWQFRSFEFQILARDRVVENAKIASITTDNVSFIYFIYEN